VGIETVTVFTKWVTYQSKQHCVYEGCVYTIGIGCAASKLIFNRRCAV